MGQAKLRPNRVAEAIQRRIAEEKEQEEQRQQRIAARKASMTPQQLKHQVQAATILGFCLAGVDANARRITEMAALQQSTRVRGRPEIVVTLDDKGGFDVDR